MRLSFEISLGNHAVKARPLYVKKINNKTFAIHYCKSKLALFELDLVTSTNACHSGIFFNLKVLGHGLEIEFFDTCHH